MGAGSAGILPALGASVAGRDMRPAAHSLSFASPKESKQRKGDPKSATPSLRYGANLGRGACGVCRRTHCALARFVQTTAASQSTMHARCDAHAHPASTPPQAQPQGVEQPDTGHRCARPRWAQALRAAQRQAERSDGPYRGCPSGRAEERRARGGHARRSAHATLSDLPQLFERSAQRAVSSAARPVTEHRRLPAAKRRDTDSRVAFSLLTFFWRSKRK